MWMTLPTWWPVKCGFSSRGNPDSSTERKPFRVAYFFIGLLKATMNQNPSFVQIVKSAPQALTSDTQPDTLTSPLGS